MDLSSPPESMLFTSNASTLLFNISVAESERSFVIIVCDDEISSPPQLDGVAIELRGNVEGVVRCDSSFSDSSKPLTFSMKNF